VRAESAAIIRPHFPNPSVIINPQAIHPPYPHVQRSDSMEIQMIRPEDKGERVSR
jgi:hypothetical protein